MNKLIIPIIVIIVGVAGFGIVLAFKNPSFSRSLIPSNHSNKCGDGVCDTTEKTNPNLCPGDCAVKDQPVSKTNQVVYPPPPSTIPKDKNVLPTRLSSKDSPFGFIIGTPAPDKRTKNINGMVDLNAKWIRLSGTAGMIWELIENTKGSYNWKNMDDEISSYYQKGINVLVTVGSTNKNYGSERGYLPSDISAYNSFLTKAVERYDGDGLNDALGSPVVAAWQIGNEVDYKAEWSDTEENYAKLLKESYQSIKSANSNTKVVMAGVSTPFGVSKYSKILSYLKNGHYFDIFDFHWHAMFGGNYKEQKIKNLNQTVGFDDYLDKIKNALNNSGNKNVKIWSTEMSISDINPSGQTELSQAVDLIKRYVYPLSKEVSVIFWGTLYEQGNFGGKPGNENYFNTQGLINNPDNDGLSHKKLSYYTYKKMVEILDGSDWNNIQTIQERDGVYVYKFTKQGKPIWVAWNDNATEKQVTISGIPVSQVKITEAVPKYESGKDVTDYSTAFNTEIRSVSNGSTSLTLKDKPVFVE